ncbi:6377_t:CDS:2 [Funneliformis mosseae]|uniref:6377_t:CDS:1 n=1 Tax=Funneliformis mosseae TaxID=27381 RepID=A0A9N8WDI7_FUNMO|nr:6377_t:CDS:2 [Funneliformis mosseae]
MVKLAEQPSDVMVGTTRKLPDGGQLGEVTERISDFCKEFLWTNAISNSRNLSTCQINLEEFSPVLLQNEEDSFMALSRGKFWSRLSQSVDPESRISFEKKEQ